jgi:hypothetical protein
MYRTLDPDRIVETIAQLERRIADRFPHAGLGRVCRELLDVAHESKARARAAARADPWLRLAVLTVLGVGLLLLGYVVSIIEVKRDAENLFGVLQGIDAAMNIVVLMGAGLLFLFTLEARANRQRTLAHLSELRSIVHVIDMHQLTKDPSALATVGSGTPSSPQRQLSPFELMRYLDYCSEMLSLAAKVAALYAQETRDPVIIETESDLVQITSNLSNKIWQKITIVQYQIATDAVAGGAAQPPLPSAAADPASNPAHTLPT